MALTCNLTGRQIAPDQLGSRIDAKAKRCEGVLTDVGVVSTEAMPGYDMARYMARQKIAENLGLSVWAEIPPGLLRKSTKQLVADARIGLHGSS